MKNKNIKINHDEKINPTIFSSNTSQENEDKQKLIDEAYLHSVDANGFRIRLEKWRKLQNA